VWEPQPLDRSTPPTAARSSFDPGAELTAELDRVGVSLTTAEFGDAVIAGALAEMIWIMSAIARVGGDRTWEGSERQALAYLAELPDDAGAEAFWEAFSCR
jgi:hypothetical protein